MPTISRRAFIAASTFAALCAPALLHAQPPAAPPARQRTLRKAIMLGMAQPPAGSSLTDTFKLIRECGFEGVEIDWPSRTKIDEFAAAQEASGLKIHGLVDSVHWKLYLNAPEPAVRDQAREALESCIATAKTLTATSILLVPGVVNAAHNYADCYSLSQDELRKVAPIASAAGITVAIENVWNNFLLSPLEAARYVDELNGPGQGVLSDGSSTSKRPFAFHFDIGNVINTGFPDQWICTLGARIAKLHIKDFSRKKRDDQGLWKGFDVELGDGDANWPAVMKALDESGYSVASTGNWATAEVRGGDATRLKQISAQMDTLFAA